MMNGLTNLTNYKLTYFNKRGGGEIIRLVFVTAGVAFEDERLETAQWDILKPGTPMGNVPVMTITNQNGESLMVCQASAIARYLAVIYGLHGSSEFEQFLIDEVYGCVGDVRQKFVQIFFSKDTKIREESRQILISTVLPKFNLYIDKRMQKYGKNGYIVGNKLTLADLAVFNMVDSCIEMGWSSFWDVYPNLMNHRNLVLENTKISEWVKNRPKTAV